MYRLPLALILCMSVGLGAAAQQTASGTLTPRIERILDAVKAADKSELAVSDEDGRFLRVLVASTRARSILEIGSASGYGTIWLGLGARQSGGRVVSIEYDAQRSREAAEHVRSAELSDIVRVIQGDAFKEIPRLPGEFDFVFLDAWKPDYEKFFEMVFPRLSAGGVFVAHNVINKKSEMSGFLQAVRSRPDLFTTIVSPSREGMSVSYKTR